jgi:hypothetical protein
MQHSYIKIFFKFLIYYLYIYLFISSHNVTSILHYIVLGGKMTGK